MAKGRQKGALPLKETVKDSEIVRLGEVRNTPNYPLPDGLYGISGGYGDYSLVKQRIAYRTGTEEDGTNKDKVIEYIIWEDVPCYTTELTDMFRSYARKLTLTEFKTKQMIGSIDELIAIQNNTYNIIDKALSGFDAYLTKGQENICILQDKKLSLEEEIKQLQIKCSKYKTIDKEIDEMYNTIKEKTAIIVNRDKEKKHRIPKEPE